jgi:hypothetical protein
MVGIRIDIDYEVKMRRSTLNRMIKVTQPRRFDSLVGSSRIDFIDTIVK